MPQALPLIILALLALSALIIIHELGHFLAAILSGVWVEEFGIGLPPRLFGKKIGNTLYSVNALPFGGFVRLHGEVGDAKVTKASMAYLNKSKPARIMISLGGIFMNMLLAIICFAIVTANTGIPKGVEIVSIIPDSPAQTAGLQSGDVIKSINNQPVEDYGNFFTLVAQNIGSTIPVTIKRSDQELSFDIEVRSEYPEDQGPMGIGYKAHTIYRPHVLLAPFVYTYYGLLKTMDISAQILIGFRDLFSQLFVGKVPPGIAGPVGVTAIMAQVAGFGILPLLEFMAIISVNLALLNLIPFPPLDGSRVIFILSEYLLNKKYIEKYEQYAYTAGFLFLIGLLILVTANEVPSLLRADSLSGFVESLVTQ